MIDEPDTPQRRKTDRSLLSRLNIHFHENWYRDVWLLCISFVLAVAIADSQSTSDKANKIALQSKNLALAIQKSRELVIRENCENQNARHDMTISALNKLFVGNSHRKIQFPPHTPLPVRETILTIEGIQTQSSRAPTILLINAIIPRQNCDQVVQRATNPNSTTHSNSKLTPSPWPIIPPPQRKDA